MSDRQLFSSPPSQHHSSPVVGDSDLIKVQRCQSLETSNLSLLRYCKINYSTTIFHGLYSYRQWKWRQNGQNSRGTTNRRRVVSLQTQPYISKVGTFKGDVTRDDCNDDFKCNTALQHCCDIVSNGYNIVPALQRCVAPKIVVANRPVQHHLKILRRGLQQQ